MLPRSISVPTLLVAATAAGPYVASHVPDWTRQFTDEASASIQSNGASAVAAVKQWSDRVANQPPTRRVEPQMRIDPRPLSTPLEGIPVQSLAEVIRFDATKEWVYQRWARKSTALSELNQFGIRVPLVTGTQLADLAGSLSYYFAADGKVQRISFHGRTADTTQIVQLATQRFGLSQQPTAVAGEQLFQTRRGADVLSELRTRPAPILWSNSLHDSFSVDMELQDPVSARPIVPPANVALEEAKKAAEAKAQANAAAAQCAAANQTSAANGKKSQSGKDGDSLWKTLFPRSRATKPQIEQLDAANLSR